MIRSEEYPHVVRLFPKESCSCPSTTQCYHILETKMCIGMESDSQKGKIHLTQLRRNVRSRTEKKSGRKHPRPGDCDIIPTPDSEVRTEETEVEPEGETQDPHLEPGGRDTRSSPGAWGERHKILTWSPREIHKILTWSLREIHKILTWSLRERYTRSSPGA